MIKKYISIVFILCMMSAGFSQTKPDTDLPWSEVAPKRNKNTKKEKAQNNGRENTEKQKPPAAGKKENKAAPGSRRSDTGRKQSVNGTENSSAVKQTPPAEDKKTEAANSGVQNMTEEKTETNAAAQNAGTAEEQGDTKVQNEKNAPEAAGEPQGKNTEIKKADTAPQNNKDKTASEKTQDETSHPHNISNGKQDSKNAETMPVTPDGTKQNGEGQSEKQPHKDEAQKPEPPHPEPVEAPEKDSLKTAKIVHRFEGGVTGIETSGSKPAFFAAGNDGFVTRYSYPDFKPDTWQLSRNPIKKMAVHPQRNLVAVYESDGFSIHQVSLWDWNLKKTLFAKRLSDSVVSLAWSANGTYLFIGNRSIEGIIVLDSNGTVHNIYAQAPGIVFLAATASTERSIVTYGESGRLVYTDIASKKKLREFRTENKLENPNLIKNFNRIIGYKNHKVFVINAVTGQTVDQYNANYAVFAAEIKDEKPIWIERTKRKNEWCIRQGEAASSGFYIPGSSKITAARHVKNHIIVGTDDGALYMLETEDTQVTVKRPLEYPSFEIEDIATDGTALFVLNSGKIYKINSPAAKPILVTEGLKTNRFKFYKNGFLLWSETNRNVPIFYYSIETGQVKTAAVPKEAVVSLSVYKNSVLYVESVNGVSVTDFNTGKHIYSYNAPGIQNAVQVDDQNIIISKSAIDKSQSPVFVINTVTRETTPIMIEGDLIFSLEQNDKTASALNCFLVNSIPSNKTELLDITLNPNALRNSTFKAVLSYKEEDLDAFLCASGSDLLTNLGKNSLVHYNTSTRSARRLKRPYSLPKKAVILQNYFVSLNYGGAVSWYERSGDTLLKTKTLNGDLPE